MDIHNEVWESLGFYVYAYVDPTNLAIRYIGKGTGNRALSHLDSNEESEKVEWIQGLKKVGKEPRIDIIARNLTEENALLIERSLIDVIELGMENLQTKYEGMMFNLKESFKRLQSNLIHSKQILSTES